MYTYAAGSPRTFSGYGCVTGFGAVTHEQAQAQAAADFLAHFGHPVPPTSPAEANWLNDRVAALKAVAGTEEAVVTRQVEAPIPPSIIGPVYMSKIQAALNAVATPLQSTPVPGLLASALSNAGAGTTAGIESAKNLYYQAQHLAKNMSFGHALPNLPKSTQTTTVQSGGGVSSAPVGTGSIVKNLTESLAKIFVSGGVPPGPKPKPQPVGGVSYQPFMPIDTTPVQPSTGILGQRVGPVTVGQIAMLGGGALVVISIMRNIIPLAILGGAGVAGAWYAKQKGIL